VVVRARALTTARVDPAWTSHELLAHAAAGTRRSPSPSTGSSTAPRGPAADIHAFLSRAEDVLA
jgi:hypothetical protein